VVRFQDERIRQRRDVERFGAVGPPVKCRQRDERRDALHVFAHAQLVREEGEIRAPIAQNLDQDLLVESARMVEVGIASERLAVQARDICPVAYETRSHAPAQVAPGIVPTYR